MNENEFEIAVGEAAQHAVWTTEHPLTHHLAEDDPRRLQYLRDYQQSVGSQVLAAIRAVSAARSPGEGSSPAPHPGATLQLLRESPTASAPSMPPRMRPSA